MIVIGHKCKISTFHSVLLFFCPLVSKISRSSVLLFSMSAFKSGGVVGEGIQCQAQTVVFRSVQLFRSSTPTEDGKCESPETDFGAETQCR